jgi:hypothetical protein
MVETIPSQKLILEHGQTAHMSLKLNTFSNLVPQRSKICLWSGGYVKVVSPLMGERLSRSLAGTDIRVEQPSFH